jgi:transposase
MLSPLPEYTRQAALSIFQPENAYLHLGDHIDQILERFDPWRFYPTGILSKDAVYRLALITIFQQMEGLSDRRAADAIFSRLDWKYALHLPLSHPGFLAGQLCDFRQELLANPERLIAFEDLRDYLAKAGFIIPARRHVVDCQDAIRGVCNLTRLDNLKDVMRAALEALSVAYPEWLMELMQPYWYDRYEGSLSNNNLPSGIEAQSALAESIGGDIFYLLQTAGKQHGQEMKKLPEYIHLYQVFRQQFRRRGRIIRWREDGCRFCLGKAVRRIDEIPVRHDQ